MEQTNNNRELLSVDEALPIVNANLKSAGRKPIGREAFIKHLQKNRIKGALKVGEGVPENRKVWKIPAGELEGWLPPLTRNPNAGTYERKTREGLSPAEQKQREYNRRYYEEVVKPKKAHSSIQPRSE